MTCWVLGLAKQAFYRGVRRPSVLSVRSVRVPGPGRWCEITALRTRASRWPICARAGCGVTAATHAIALRESPATLTRRLCGPHSGCWTPTSRTPGRHDDLKRRLDRQRARADRARASTSTWTPPTPSASPPSSPRSSDSEPPGRSQSGVCGGVTRPASRRCDACLCGLYCCVPGPDAHVRSGGPVAAFEQFLEVLIAVWGVRARQSPYDQRHQHAADPARIEVQRERDT